MKTNLMGVMERCPGYWGRDSSCHGYCDQYINEEGSPKTKARFALTLHSIPCFLKEESVKNKMLIN
jgi:hypothetical protein